MELTREEERILDGDEGPVRQKAMEILVALGDVYGARGLVKVKSAQVAGVSYKTVGDAGLRWLESLSTGKVQVPTTLNPAGMDLTEWRRMGIPEDFARKQLRIVEAYKAVGVSPTCSCTPYLVGNRPSRGEHVAWSESSAVCYANSILGAFTNREGGPSALASALVGRTPCHGYHVDQNRVPTTVVNLEADLDEESCFSLLGWWIGRTLGAGVPRVVRLGTPGDDGLKALAAGLATTGSIAMFHIGESDRAAGGPLQQGAKERLRFTKDEFEEARDDLTTSRVESVDLTALGCPHASIGEIRKVANILRGRRVRPGSRLWVFTSSHVKSFAQSEGVMLPIIQAGGEVFADTCMVVAPLEQLGVSTIAVNSAKAAAYLPATSHADVVFGRLEECITLACDR